MITAIDFRDPDLINSAYLIASVLFILGLRQLSSPKTARSGNYMAAVGMAIALFVTLLDRQIIDFKLIILGVVIGVPVGAISARKVKMTAMPQMVALFNGVGGGAVALVALSEFREAMGHSISLPVEVAITIPLSALIGSISFAGSIVAFGKLQELVGSRPITFPLQKVFNFLLFAGALAAVAVIAIMSGQSNPSFEEWLLISLVGVALFLGVMLVIPIGGADMPVVISLLNSFTGLAAALAGFVLSNSALLIGGALVGASGTLLTILMGRAMNRSLGNVLFGAFGGGDGGAAGVDIGDKTVHEINAQDAAIMLSYADNVVFVPGYGLAVAQAQHNVRELGDILEKRGVDVKYAIHPVAGRMPGHMNVLLAEADVPYPQLYDMDDINPDFPRTDVVVVIGANDVVNPSARDDPGSVIAGMPILEVDKAKQVIVLKRSMSPGFAGIDNPLFYLENNAMLFGDGKDSVMKITKEVEQL